MMDVWIALRDPDDGGMSAVIGAFSADEKAMTACQDDEKDTASGWGRQYKVLAWHDDQATGWGCEYTIILTHLDRRIGE